jgi:acyl carrier protein
LYQTGDRVRWRADGQLEFLGRLDGQVKVRGVRIETGEIEAVLENHPGIARAVVATREESTGDTRLLAWVVPVNGCRPSSDSLRAHLKQKLPPAMIPAAIVPLEQLPMTSNGKVDRAALPAGEPESKDRHAAPRNPMEKRIARIWSEVLGGRPVGVHDDFFELGGHSLSATQVVSRLQSEFGVPLSLRSLFDHPTVAEVAAVVAALEPSKGERKVKGTRPTPLPAETLMIDA